MTQLLIISPHLDDAVFSCGDLLVAHPGAVLVTVFAGAPRMRCTTPWDRACGFRDSDQAMHVRRQEDLAALARLRARPLWLGFLDSQYCVPDPVLTDVNRKSSETVDGTAASVAMVTGALADIIAACAPDMVLFPCGLFHSDHDCVHRACLPLVDEFPHLMWLAYVDALYRRMPGLLQERLAELWHIGRIATPAFPDISHGHLQKRLAVLAYRSQWRVLGHRSLQDIHSAEQYWSLA